MNFLKHPIPSFLPIFKFCLYFSSKPWQVFAPGWLLRKWAECAKIYIGFLVMFPFRTSVCFPESVAFELFASYKCKSSSSNSPDHLEMEGIGVMLNISQCSFHFKWCSFRGMDMYWEFRFIYFHLHLLLNLGRQLNTGNSGTSFSYFSPGQLSWMVGPKRSWKLVRDLDCLPEYHQN